MNGAEGWVLAVHAGATWFMVGLIWFVQVVHYPLMARVGEGAWREYERLHQRLTTLIVGPAMLAELATGAWLLLMAREREAGMVYALGLALIAVAWVSTAVLQVPCHRRLEGGFDPRTHRRLVTTNWIRTAAWSARAVLVGWAMLG